MNLENRCVEIKNTLQKLTDVKNPTARLIALLMECGVTATSELAELVGVGERAIQKARKLLPQANEGSRTTVRTEPQFANHSSAGEPQFAKSEPEFVASRTHARAQIELPSEVLTLEVKKDTPPPPKGPGKQLCLEAFEAYNATALRCGIPQAARFTPDRERKIAARLKDYGIEGWHRALANIEKSSFLTGTNDRGWRASLDFLLQAESFGKVHDGGYGNGRHAKAGQAPLKQVYDQNAEKAAREYWARVDGMIQ